MNRLCPIRRPFDLLSPAPALALGLLLMPGPVRAEGEQIVDLDICQGLEGRQGVGCGARFAASVGEVHAVMAVRVPQGSTGAVQTVWRHGERIVQRQTLSIPFHRAGGYRTRARQRIARSHTGAWSLEVVDAAGRRLALEAFSVGAAGPAAAIDPPAADGPADAPEPEALEAADGPADGPEPEAIEAADGPADGPEPEAIGAADGPADGPEPEAIGAADGPADGPESEAMEAADGPADAPEPEVIEAPADAPNAAAAVDAPPAAPEAPTPAPEAAPVAAGGDATPAVAGAASSTSADAERRVGGILLLLGGLLLVIAGVVIARRRAGRAAAVAAEPPAPVAEPPPASPPPVAAAAVADDRDAAATDALQRLTDLVARLWGRWVTASGGSPQRALNTAWREVPDAGRVGLDHIRLCNALEEAARTAASIPPRGDSVDILRARLHEQAPALMGVVCALAIEAERLDLPGLGLDEAFAPWGGRPGLTAELLRVLDDGARAVGTTRLNVVPYETKATTASRDFDAELRPFPVPAALAERLGAGNRVVRVESPPFADAGPPVVWGVSPG